MSSPSPSAGPDALRLAESWACLDLAVPGDPPFRIEAAGPFQAGALPPDDGWAFYVNDFSLTSAAPWQVPALTGTASPDPAGGEPLEIAWRDPDKEAFRTVFHDVLERIRGRQLLKAVPVSTRLGKRVRGSLRRTLPGLLAPHRTAGRGKAFAWITPQGGFAGISPEVLFRLNGPRLTTMALAGTVDAAHEEELHQHPKLVREHEIVVDELHRRLTTLGRVAVSKREVMTLGTVRHLRTSLSVDLASMPRGEALNDLIRLLHPTPALGISPRNDGTLELLGRWRSTCQVPSAFGAPFGVVWPGGALFAIAIRGLFWQGDDVFLPAGGGLVAGSDFETEWEELELKRAWVSAALAGGA